MAVDITELIRERLGTFSKGQVKIAEALLNDYDKTAYLTAANLGQSVGVSESTVVRFATELGFPGYPEFRRALQESVRRRLTSSQRIEVTNARMGGGDLFHKVMLGEIEKIKRTLDTIDRTAFDRGAELVSQAKHIYVMGVRSSSALASLMHYNLSMICHNVRLIQPTGFSDVTEQVLEIGAGDVLIAISFPRYSARVERAVGVAKAAGASVIALTDSELSPIAQGADCLLAAQSDMVSFVDSLTAPVALMNAFLAVLADKSPKEAKERLDRLEHIWDEHHVYDKR